MDDLKASWNDIIAAALDAEKKGVPVDWKEMNFIGCNVATNYIAMLEQRLQERDANESPR